MLQPAGHSQVAVWFQSSSSSSQSHDQSMPAGRGARTRADSGAAGSAPATPTPTVKTDNPADTAAAAMLVTFIATSTDENSLCGRGQGPFRMKTSPGDSRAVSA